MHTLLPVYDSIMRDTRKQQYSDNKLVKRLQRQVGKVIAEFNMIEAGDRVMVCLSGGKLYSIYGLPQTSG